PTMMGGQRRWFARIRDAVDLPGLGPFLYRINVSRPIITKMAREHVYSDPDWLSGDRLVAKLAITRAPGARHGSVRFVSGGLDLVDSRDAFRDFARRVNVPILVIYGDETIAEGCHDRPMQFGSGSFVVRFGRHDCSRAFLLRRLRDSSDFAASS
ncbi:MAG: hypothetical protein J0H36_07705, partial [Hyphomicrobium denitrificans]|nr:hypothetical protein [Hyphomicrobium denitrificans]